MRSGHANRRIRLLLAVFAVVLGITLARTVWLQVVRSDDLSRLAAKQQHETVTVAAGRGTIFDRLGVQLAIGEEATTVYANPREVRDPRAVALAAQKALGVNPNALYPQLLDRRKGFLYVERKADPERSAPLERQQLLGLGFYPEERRTYPQGSVAAQVLGYAGVDNRGLAGLELGLEKTLAGRAGRETIVKDPFGRTIDVISSAPERDGRNVFLTVDHTIQANAEAILRATVRQWRAKSATAIVLEPETGNLLAMAVAPSFDANVYPRVRAEAQRNRAVTDTYEPGSTFKIVTVAGALSEGIVTAGTPFRLPYSMRVADKVIHDSHPRGTVTLTVGQILSHSSNVGAATLGGLLGRERLGKWVERFGFGRKTGIDFPGESQGIVPPSEQWYGSAIGTVPIGQGIAVTPVQMAAAYAAVANEGVWVQPHLVDRVSSKGRPRPERRRVVSPEIAKQLLGMLVNVVAEGTGTWAAVPGYTVAGKTGTAQKPDPVTGGYSKRYVASFLGIVPASKPRLVILVIVDEPKGAIWGGVVAAPAFREIAKFDLQYLEVPPDAPRAVSGAAPASLG